MDEARGDTPLTYFEFGTAAARDIMVRERPDLAVLEVGLGGRLDAVNAVDPDVAVVTSVALDHQDWLGDTIDDIAREKAGICRADRPAVLGEVEHGAVLRRHVEATGARPSCIGEHFDAGGEGATWRFSRSGRVLTDLPGQALPGAALRRNAACALEAYALLEGGELPEAPPLRQAFATLALPGRLQAAREDPPWLLDVAHNPAAAAVLAEQLRDSAIPGTTWAVMAALADKDVEGIVEALRPVVDRWLLAGANTARGLDPRDLDARVRARSVEETRRFDDVASACAWADRHAAAADRVVVLGSFHAVGPSLDYLEAARPAPGGDPR